jgi:hypothetical protein
MFLHMYVTYGVFGDSIGDSKGISAFSTPSLLYENVSDNHCIPKVEVSYDDPASRISTEMLGEVLSRFAKTFPAVPPMQNESSTWFRVGDTALTPDDHKIIFQCW